MVATGDTVVVPTGDPIFAFAGIARPERFFADLEGAGWRMAGTLAFRDHHRFDAHDVDRIRTRAKAARAAIVLTTEKDAVRLPAGLQDLPLATVPLVVTIEPAEAFTDWVMERISRQARVK
jgi:tetraacyldisaccharide 4'-kinase